MNINEALKEAREVIGKEAYIYDNGVMSEKVKKKRAISRKRGDKVRTRYRYQVGTISVSGIGIFFIEGESNTSFEVAIKKASIAIKKTERSKKKSARERQKTCGFCRFKATFRQSGHKRGKDEFYTCKRHIDKIIDPVPYPKALQKDGA